MLSLLLACHDSPSPAVEPPPPDLGLGVTVPDAAAGLCVSVQLDRWDADHRARMVQALHDLGVRELRHDLRWNYAQPARDTFDWTTEDNWTSAAADFEVIAMLGYGNTWASGEADSFYPPDDPADFAAFAGAAATRYPDIHRWEIWNELNAGYRFWKVGDPPAISGDPVGYAALFAAAAEALPADDEVEIGGTFFHEMAISSGPDFVAEAIASDPRVLSEADALAVHPYTLYPPRVGPEETEGNEMSLGEMFDAMSASAPGLPLVITEAGWPSYGEVDAETQAAFLLREFALAQAGGVRDVCWYTLEDGEDPANSEDDFGLVGFDGVTKPAGTAFASLAEAIDGLDANGDAAAALGLPAGVYAVRWSSSERTATMVWTTGAATDVELPASAGACDAEGVSVSATEMPVIVREEMCP